MKRTLIILGILMALAGFMSHEAKADTIYGGLAFSGVCTFYSNWTGDASTSTTTTDMSQVTEVIFPSSAFLVSSTGSFAGLTSSSVTFSPIAITGGTVTNLPLQPMWTFTDGATYSFDLTSATVTVTNGSLDINGIGTIYAGTQSAPAALNIFTGQNVNGASSFSDSTGVPEPSTLLLCGIGLLGLGLVGFKRKFI
jgi:hypothetical protein